MKSLIAYIKECYATPMNSIGIGNIQDTTDNIGLVFNKKIKNKKHNKHKSKE